jgi:hypothetical protein
LGSIDAASGSASDCLHVDGSSGACGSSGGGAASFVDGDSPAGIVDGSNTAFTLSQTPSPVTSLALYRNGILQKVSQDYTLSGNTLTYVRADTPQPGDTLLASYRLAGTGGATQSNPSPQVLCAGTGASTTGVSMTAIGACAIPSGLLLAGDRVEIHFDLARPGAYRNCFGVHVRSGLGGNPDSESHRRHFGRSCVSPRRGSNIAIGIAAQFAILGLGTAVQRHSDSIQRRLRFRNHH